MVEPQEECEVVLRRLVAWHPRAEMPQVALTEPGVSTVSMTGFGSMGAWLTPDDGTDRRKVRATSLDDLLEARLDREDRTLLKLDLEPHELCALRGAVRTLAVVEAVLVEIAFYDFGKMGRPVFSDLLAFLGEAHFQLYDLASLSGRARDQRLRMGDAIFVRRGSPLLEDRSD